MLSLSPFHTNTHKHTQLHAATYANVPTHQSTPQTQPQSHANQHVCKDDWKEEAIMTTQRKPNLTVGGVLQKKKKKELKNVEIPEN